MARGILIGTVLLVVGCDPEFEVHRGELGPFRVAGLGVEKTPEMECPQATAMVWSGLGAYHDVHPGLSWSMEGVLLGEGYGVEVCGAGLLELEAVSTDGGSVQHAQVRVELPEVWEFQRESVGVLESVGLDDRLAQTGEPVTDVVEQGTVARVRLAGLSDDYEVHWMTPSGGGAALSLDRVSADVFPENLAGDGDLSERDMVLGCEAGCVLGHLALAVNGDGGNGWSWVETAHGLESGLLRHEGWLLEAGLPPETRWASVTLRVDDDSARGFSFEDWQALEEADESLLNPGCGIAGKPFELDWIVEGRCTRTELDGLTIVLEAW